MSKSYDELNDIHENSGDFYSRVTLQDYPSELASLRAEVERLRDALGKVTTVYLGAKNRTENFGMIYDALNKHAKEALK